MAFVLLDFDGDLQSELYITLEIRTDLASGGAIARAKGRLPAADRLIADYQHWRSLHDTLWGIYRLGEPSMTVVQGSGRDLMSDFLAAGDQLVQSLNQWLRDDAFRAIREKLLEKLQPNQEICCILQTANPWLRRLPWHLWDFLERYPKAEIALSSPSYEAVTNTVGDREHVRILAVLGHAAGIDVERDRQLLDQLPYAQVQVLAEPSRQDLYAALWDAQGWDILCFSGHSTTPGAGDRGYLTINAEDTLHLGDIAHALKKAVKQGLKVAIFNSCDGLGLAHQMEPFAIPNTIIMREPVPDHVAQAFLKGFLQSFCNGQPLPLAVREGREQLQALEADCPFASWLPVLFQNPTQRYGTTQPVPTLYWRDLYRAPQVLPRCPYQGLAPFTAEDAAVFFGREETVEKLTYAVYTKPFVALLGASGSGKSSLILAGLLPHLAQEALPLVLRPTAEPLAQLIAALAPHLPESYWTSERLQTTLQKDPTQLSSLLAKIALSPPRSRLLLIIDQFEELYTLCDDRAEQITFLRCLQSVLPDELDTRSRFEKRAAITVVITLRADFLDAALSDPELAPILCTYPPELLRPMGRTALRAAIERPAAQRAVNLTPGLTDRLLDAVGEQPGNLPLLEFTLTLLWERQSDRQLTHAAYDAIGGVEAALVTYAEGIYAELDEEQRQQARHIFVQLVHPGEGRADTRRLADRANFDASFTEVLAHLASQRLLVVEQHTVELVHEVLITAWTRLRDWLAADRNFRLWQDHLNQELQRWQHHDQPDNRLLHGAALEEAQHWLLEQGATLNHTERDYINVSLARSQLDQKIRKRLKAMLVSGFVTASLLAGVSLWQWQRAVVGNMTTQLSVLSGASEQLLASKKELDALLASIRAVNQVRNIRGEVRPETRIRAIATLQQAVHQIREVNRLEGHERTVIDAAYSPDGEHLVSVSDDRTVRLWQQDGTLLRTMADHSDLVRSVSWHPNGQRFITASYDQTLRLWQRDGGLLATWEGHNAKINRVAWSPDGKYVASVDADGEVIVWTARGEKWRRWHTGQGWLGDVVWHPERSVIAIAGSSGVRLWDLQGRALATLAGHEQTVNALSFSPDGEHLLTAGKAGLVRLWRSDGTLLQRWEAHGDRIVSVSFSPDGRQVATASTDKTTKLWNTDGQLLKVLEGHNAPIYRAAFHPTAPHLVTVSADTTLRIWHLTGQPRDQLSHTSAVNVVRFHPHNNQLITGTQAGDIRLWQRNGQFLRRLYRHGNEVQDLQFNPAGKTVFSAGVNRQIQAQTLKGKVNQKYRGDLEVDLSPDGQWLVMGSPASQLQVVRQNGESLQTLQGHQSMITTTRFSPDGRLLASGSEDETVRIWRREGDRFSPDASILRGHGSTINQVAWTPDGQVLASASDDGTIRLWQRTRSYQFAPRAKVLRGHLSKVQAVAFSPDGQILASGGEDGTVKLWTLQGTLLTTFEGHEGAVRSLDFSPDGLLLASASSDTTTILWNLNLYFLLDRGCEWLRDYLSTNPSISQSDRRLCQL